MGYHDLCATMKQPCEQNVCIFLNDVGIRERMLFSLNSTQSTCFINEQSRFIHDSFHKHFLLPLLSNPARLSLATIRAAIKFDISP
jgi:hypothetical protein